MDASLGIHESYAPIFLSLHNTYISHILAVKYIQQSTRWFNGGLGTYFLKLLVILLKQAEVDGCKPSRHTSNI
jgi:hypothetical protein